MENKNIIDLAKEKRSRNINEVHEESLSLGDKIADRMAEVAGSWTFIIVFVLTLLLWVGINSIQAVFHTFDPFPFILLNLLLSCVAALQAPVIMMSQNRQEKKDRIRAEHDYEINLKSEILIEDVLNRLEKIELTQNSLLEKLISIEQTQNSLLEKLISIEVMRD
ncbi:MAG: DUF1003 domain-containing protein [Bacillota bacterium]